MMKTSLLFFAALAVARCQEYSPTQADNVANVLDVYHQEDWMTWFQKMPVELTLNLPDVPPLPVFEPRPQRTARLQFEIDYARGTAEPVAAPISSELRLIDADALQPPATIPVRESATPWPLERTASPPAQLANFRKPMRIAAPPRNLTEPLFPTGTTVTFSSQGDAAIQALTGKGLTDFQVIVATICRWTPGQSFSFGLVTQLANSIGIETISKETGSAIVQHRVDLNWHNLWPFLIKYGSITAAAVMSSGVVGNVGRGAIFATVMVHESADDLPILFGRGAPNPDPYLRNSTASTDRIDLMPGECKEAQFSGVYSGPSTTFVTDRLQLLP